MFVDWICSNNLRFWLAENVSRNSSFCLLLLQQHASRDSSFCLLLLQQHASRDSSFCLLLLQQHTSRDSSFCLLCYNNTHPAIVVFVFFATTTPHPAIVLFVFFATTTHIFVFDLNGFCEFVHTNRSSHQDLFLKYIIDQRKQGTIINFRWKKSHQYFLVNFGVKI